MSNTRHIQGYHVAILFPYDRSNLRSIMIPLLFLLKLSALAFVRCEVGKKATYCTTRIDAMHGPKHLMTLKSATLKSAVQLA